MSNFVVWFWHTIKPGTRNNGTRNTDGTPEHWRGNGTLEEQSEYHGILSRYHNRIQNKKVI